MHFYNILTVGQFSWKLSHLMVMHAVAEGGARKSVRTPSSNIVEFKMKIKNLFSKLKSDFKEKRYDGLKKGA